MLKKDIEILKTLAVEFKELAGTDRNLALKELWIKHNALKSERPLILCFPEGAWREILPVEDMICTEPLAKVWERNLRQKIYTISVLKDDHPFDTVFDVENCVVQGDYGVELANHRTSENGSYAIDAPIKDIEHGIEGLKYRRPVFDAEQTRRRLETAKDIFDGILEVKRFGCVPQWTMGLTSEAIKLIGLEGLMMAMYDQPQALHKLMAWLRDEHLNFISWFENGELLTLNNTNGYTGSGGVAYTDQLPAEGYKLGGPARLKDLWGFAESQETVGVSPEMFAKFVLPYQMPLLERYGLNCYGCCEGVDKRWEYIRKIPRLRRVSVAPWADQKTMADVLGRKYIYSRKPNPTLVCAGEYDEQAIGEDLRTTIDIAGGCNLEIILKDTHTVCDQPWRLARWVEVAKGAVCR